MKYLSRRDFLKIAGGTAAVACAALTTGCSSGNTGTPNNSGNGASNATGNTAGGSVMIETNEGIIEGEEAVAQVDSITAALTGSSFVVGPFGAASGPRDWINLNLYACLLAQPYYGAPLEECEPWIAKSYTKVDDLTYDFEIFDNISDSEGNHITVDDVLWSYDMMSTEGSISSIGKYVESMEKTDDYHFTMKLKMNGSNIMEQLTSHYRMDIISQKWYEGADEDAREYNPATTGAYKVVSYAPGSSLVIEAVDNYWMPEDIRPTACMQNVKTIYYNVIAEASMRSIALESKEIDITQINASELRRFYVDGVPVDGYNVLVNGPNLYLAMLFNMDPDGTSPFASNVELRQACLYAVNAEDTIYANGGDLTTAVVCKTLGLHTCGGYLEDFENEDYWQYDLEKAKEHMAASGYKEGELTVRLLSRTTTGDAVHAVFVNAFEQLGIKTELLAFDQALFNQYKNDSTMWDIILDSKGAATLAADWYSLFVPTGNKTKGTGCFTQDDGLVDVINAAFTDSTPENIYTAHNYLKELAVGKALNGTYKFTVGQAGILKLTASNCFNPRINAFVFADDYKSLVTH